MRIIVISVIVIFTCLGCRQDCQFDAVDLTNTKSVHLISEYIKKDARAERLRMEPWFLDVVIWPDEPGYDSYTIIRGYDITPLSADSSTARVRVSYQRIGYIRTTSRSSVRFDKDAGIETFVYTAVLTDNGWRIAAPQIEPHVLAKAAISYSPLNDNDRKTVSSF